MLSDRCEILDLAWQYIYYSVTSKFLELPLGVTLRLALNWVRPEKRKIRHRLVFSIHKRGGPRDKGHTQGNQISIFFKMLKFHNIFRFYKISQIFHIFQNKCLLFWKWFAESSHCSSSPNFLLISIHVLDIVNTCYSFTFHLFMHRYYLTMIFSFPFALSIDVSKKYRLR